MVLIIGITGFIGRAVATFLTSEGIPFCGVSRSLVELTIASKTVKVYSLDRVSIEDIFIENKITHVVNLSVNYGRSNESFADMLSVNVTLPLAFYDTANFYGAESFIQVDSFLQKDSFQSENKNYIATKNMAREALLDVADETTLCIAQLEHVYGPNDKEHKLIGSVIDRYSKGFEKIHVGFCDILRDLIYVDDVAELLCELMKNNKVFERQIVEVGTGQMITLRTALETMRKHLLERTPSQKFEIFYGQNNGVFLSSSHADITPLGEKTGWRPKYDIEKGMITLISLDDAIKGY